MPSGNSVTAYVLLRLHHITQNKQFLEITKKIVESQARSAAENPFAFGYLLNVLYLYYQKPTEITVINDMNSQLVSSLRKKFLPESIMVLVTNENNLKTLSKHAFFSGKEFQDDKTSVFVCKNFSCSLPLSDLSEIEKEL
jgi:uncharacterized protein YyaL (SSP411 family)